MTVSRKDVLIYERERWQDENWDTDRLAHAGRIKGQAAGALAKRLATVAYLTQHIDTIEHAHADLGCLRGEPAGGTRLAAQLMSAGMLTQRGVDPTKLSDKGKAWADALINESGPALIAEAVLECRTLMTARCLSADFEGETMGELEERYVEIIADIINLDRRLRYQRSLLPDDLAIEARRAAIDTARDQRRNKKPDPMIVRERFWAGRSAPVRKVFERQT